ncbi:hypothetical protein CFP59_04073 [Streptomyces malaysiensis subsp. malaysiensis]|nr:hypothetical protein CFP59_04073 [Streptomyces sp. M56]
MTGRVTVIGAMKEAAMTGAAMKEAVVAGREHGGVKRAR